MPKSGCKGSEKMRDKPKKVASGLKKNCFADEFWKKCVKSLDKIKIRLNFAPQIRNGGIAQLVRASDS